MVDKTTQRARPNYPDMEEYGWTLKDGVLQAVPANGPLWLQDLFETASCGSKKSCSRNCSYAKGSAKFKRQIQGHNTLMKNIKSQKIVYYSSKLSQN